METVSNSRVRSYAMVAIAAPFVITSICLCVVWFLDSSGYSAIDHYGIMGLSIGVGAVGLVAALRHWRWHPLAWGVAALIYCIVAYWVLVVFGMFFIILVLGGGF
jgi:hypothetical protein